MSPLERVAAFLSESPGVAAAYAFGSVAEGRAHRQSAAVLRANPSLHNDVMLSLLAVARLVIDIAGPVM